MPRLSEKLLLLVMLTAVAAGCKPKVGDDCKLSTDCSAAGDRLCDITAPGGYCTVYNCEPGTCPEDESLCVEFGAQRSPNVACQDLQSPSPYGRAFCMATCEKDSDCRPDYTCADLSADIDTAHGMVKRGNAWGALLIDHDRGHRACLVPVSAAPVPGINDEAMGKVCTSALPSATPAADVPGQGGAGG